MLRVECPYCYYVQRIEDGKLTENKTFQHECVSCESFFELEFKIIELRSGTDEALESGGQALWNEAIANEQARTARIPTEQDAINLIFDAVQRLKELGWNDPIYCPKDGTLFKAIEGGSTGIFDCHYDGEWPEGGWWVHDEFDSYPSRPLLFKPNTCKSSAATND